MGDSINEVVKSKTEIELNGKKYTISPFTMGDLADFERHLKNQRRQEIKESAEGLKISPAELIKLMNEPFKPDIDSEMETISGVSFMLWRVLKKSDKELTLEEVRGTLNHHNGEYILGLLMDGKSGEAMPVVNP